jgi:hypothetical protein
VSLDEFKDAFGVPGAEGIFAATIEIEADKGP